NLDRDMKKLKENVHAIQVGCQNFGGAHFDKDCPHNEEVKSVEKAKYGEFGRPSPFSNGAKYRVVPPGYYTRIDSRLPFGEKRPRFEELMNKHLEESTRRRAEMEEWADKKTLHDNGQREVNHANQFVPKSVQLNAGRPNINSVRPNINTGRTNINSFRPNINTGRTNINSVRPNINTSRVNVNSVRPNVNTGRVNVNSVRPRVNTGSSNVNTVRSRQPVPTKTSNSFSPKRPQVNQLNQRRHFTKSHSPVSRPIVRNTTRMNYSHAVKGN
ncbi:hypothetical protein Tco_1049915, partial [Tanacetum coccineum]